MLVALSACAIGYAKIGAEIINRLKNEKFKRSSLQGMDFDLWK